MLPQQEIQLVMDIHMRRLPSEETYGVMMSFDAVRGRLLNSIDFAEICGSPSCGYPFLVGLTDVG